MRIEKFKHTGEIVTGNVYVPQSIYDQLGADKKLIWEYITMKNAIIYCSVDGSGFIKIGKDNDLGEIHWINDENTRLEVLEFPQKEYEGVSQQISKGICTEYKGGNLTLDDLREACEFMEKSQKKNKKNEDK